MQVNSYVPDIHTDTHRNYYRSTQITKIIMLCSRQQYFVLVELSGMCDSVCDHVIL